MRSFVIGDIHGAFRALEQVLLRSGFRDDTDQLIVLGDVVDGWPDTRLCLDRLLKIRHLVPIMGNHDLWCQKWMMSGWKENLWLSQGGKATVVSYDREFLYTPGIPDVSRLHVAYFEAALPYYLDSAHRLFVHGGLNPELPIEDQSVEDLCWDRRLFETACYRQYDLGNPAPLTGYSAVFIGHTATDSFSLEPVHACEVWNLDQGAGWSGKLTLMDVETLAYWQSDAVPSLYPGIMGR